ncbi:hypothetical protein BDY24DRAFT_17738 [Mrakia frigida]|uniref:uncharacterized protein n=1 Tax=Mrakia frigida TaxID=29902 RepID=UPI003FCBF314
MSIPPTSQDDPEPFVPPNPKPKGNLVLDSDEEGEEVDDTKEIPPDRPRSTRSSTAASRAVDDRSSSSPLSSVPDEDGNKPRKDKEPGLPQLPDYLLDSEGRGAKLIFCGVQPGLAAATKGHHWAASGLTIDGTPKKANNCFYKLLNLTDFTDEEHLYSQDYTFPDRYSIGLTTAIRDSSLRFPSTLDISSGLEELFEKVVQLRPLLVCFKGLTKLTDAVLHRLNEYGRDGHPEYVDLRRTDVKNGWIPFKMEQDDGSTTYFCSILNPSHNSGTPIQKRVAELQPFQVHFEEMKEDTFVEPAGMRTVNLAPLRRNIAARAARVPSPPQEPRPIKRSASPSMVEAPPSPKRPRPSLVQRPVANAIAGPSRLRDQELGLDPREQTEEPPASRAADDLGVERDELARVFKETEAAFHYVGTRNGQLETEITSLEDRLAEKEREVVERRDEIRSKDKEVEDLKREKQKLEDEKVALLAAQPPPAPAPAINAELVALDLSPEQTEALRRNLESQTQLTIKKIADAQANVREAQGLGNENYLRLAQRELRDLIQGNVVA